MNALRDRHASLAFLLVASAVLAGPAGAGRRTSAHGCRDQGREGLVKANGITIAYEDFGPKDREAMLLIMGNGTQLTAWPIELIEELVREGLPGRHLR